MKWRRTTRHFSALSLSLIVLTSLAVPVLSPFSVGTASGASAPSMITTVVGGDFKRTLGTDTSTFRPLLPQTNKMECAGSFLTTQPQLNDAIISTSLGFNDFTHNWQNSSKSMWNYQQGGDGPGNFDAYKYSDYLAQNNGKIVSAIGLYQPDSNTGKPDKCGSKAADGSPYLILLPVAGNSPTDPTIWAARQISNYGFSNPHPIYVFFEKNPGTAGTNSNGDTVGSFYIYVSTDPTDNRGHGEVQKLTNKVVGGVPKGSANTTIHTKAKAEFVNVATISVTMEITDPATHETRTAHEIYKDHNWDKFSYYFLDSTDDPTRQGLTYTAQNLDAQYDPRCDPTVHQVPFIWIKYPDNGGGGDCNDDARNAINLDTDDINSFQKKVSLFGMLNGGRTPQIFNYDSNRNFANGPDPVISSLPAGQDLVFTARGGEKVWFYINSDRTVARSVWLSGDGNEQPYIGDYSYDEDTQKFLLSTGQCAIGIAGITFPNPADATRVTYGNITGYPASVDWILRKPDNNCGSDYKVATVSGLVVSQKDFDETAEPPPGDASLDNSLCGQASSGGLNWVFCSLAEYIQSALTWMEDQVRLQLHIDVDTIFGNGSGQYGENFHHAWTVFRSLAYALLVILGIIMVISQILGFDFFDAYTIRKMLPKIVIASIFIPLLWPILHILLQMSNDAADAVQGLLTAPFGGPQGSLQPAEITFSYLLFHADSTAVDGAASAGLGIGLLVGGGFLAIAGWGVSLAVLASAALSLAVAYVTLVVRDIILYGFIILSAVIVVGTIFAPTAKAANQVIRAAGAATIVQILVMLYLALGQDAAWIAYTAGQANATSGDEAQGAWWGTVLAVIALVVSYVMAWKYFQQAFQWSKVVNSLAEGAQKGLAKYRSEARKQRLNEAVEGRRKFGGFIGTATGASWAANRMAGLVRRGRLSGQVGAGAFGIGRTGRAKYNEAVKTMQAGVTAKMVEQDKNRAGGDDDAMRLLGRRGMNGGRFIKEYADIQQRRDKNLSRGEAEQRARTALGLSESSLGAVAGTNAMRVAAQRSLLSSNTSYRSHLVRKEVLDENGQGTGQYEWQEEMYDFDTMSRTMYGDVAELVQDGLISEADGVSMIKSNAARTDRSAVGFGESLKQLKTAATEGTDKMTTHTMLEDALSGAQSGQLFGQRHESARILAPEILKRAQAATARDKTADGTRQLGREFIQQVAMAAGRIDMAGSLPELNGELLATSYTGAKLESRELPDGTREAIGPTVGQWVEFFRTPPNRAHDHEIYRELHRGHAAQIRASGEGAAIEADVRSTIGQARLAAALGRPVTPKDTDNAINAAIARRADEETERQIDGAQTVFNEYRREYSSAWQQQAGAPAPEGK